MIFAKDVAWHASVALRKNSVFASLATFHIRTLSRTTALFGLPVISETVTGMPSGSKTSIFSSRVSLSTAKYSVVGENLGGRFTEDVDNELISKLYRRILRNNVFITSQLK